MRNEMYRLTRRDVVKLAGVAAAGAAAGIGYAADSAVSLFDGKTLDGWLQIENSATSLASGGITDATAFAAKLTKASDAVSVYLRGRLQDSVKADLAGYSPSNENAKTVVNALVKDLNAVFAGPSIYDKARFRGVVLRAETARLAAENPGGQQLARLNKLLIEDAYPGELAKSVSTGWVVKDGAMASTGSGRGVIYSAKGLRPLPADVYAAARIGKSGSSRVRADLLHAAARRREATRRARRDSVPGSQRRSLGLPARE